MLDHDNRETEEDPPAGEAVGPAEPCAALNARQEAFCQFYVRNNNASASARLAGYGDAGAGRQGHRLLKDDRIRRRLSALRDAIQFERGLIERIWTDKLDAIHYLAIVNGSLQTAVRAIEAQIRLARYRQGDRSQEPGAEEAEAEQQAEIDEWIRRGEANIARARERCGDFS